ncbi:unnamed protein product, partial [Mesorhabditis spiculigera]
MATENGTQRMKPPLILALLGAVTGRLTEVKHALRSSPCGSRSTTPTFSGNLKCVARQLSRCLLAGQTGAAVWLTL